MNWILMVTIYQTIVTPAFSGPDAVNFKPETTVIHVSSEEICNKLGLSVTGKNPTRPAKSHPLSTRRVTGPQANYSCSKS